MKKHLPIELFEETNWSILMEQISNTLATRYNVNDNVGKALPNNDNVNNVSKSETMTNAIADKLVRELNNPGARLFYCKVAWSLSESAIYRNLDIAKTGRNPQKYFTWLCIKAMK